MNLYNIGKLLILETVSRSKILPSMKNRNVVTFWYDDPDEGEGIKPGYREVEPYVFGRHYKSGNEVIRAWLIRGVSKTGELDPSLVPGWRLFRVDRMGNWIDTGDTFEPYVDNSPVREKYNPDDKHMISGRGKIYYKIEPEGEEAEPVIGEPTKKKSWWQRAKEKIRSLFNEEYLIEDVELLD